MIYYGFGNILNDTYEVCSWDPWFDLSMEIDGPDGTIANCVQARIDILLHFSTLIVSQHEFSITFLIPGEGWRCLDSWLCH